MLRIEPLDYKFCPLCGKTLGIKQIETKDYKYCSICDWIYFPHVETGAAGVAIIDGKLLLVKRAKNPYKNTWTFPAGFVSFGEHPKETAIREVKEETGYQAKIIRLIDIEQVTDDPRSVGHFVFFYQIDVNNKTDPLDKNENSDIGWFNTNNLPNVVSKSHRNIMNKIRRNLS